MEQKSATLAGCSLSVTLRLDPEPVQVGYAREQVRKVTPGWGLAEHDDLLQLIVSELVTNSLAHCDGPIEVRLSYDGIDLWIEVSDNGNEMPVRQDPDDEDESGRGLQLVDGLIEMYGGVRGTAEHSSRAGKTSEVISAK
jgi:signal transduction histidine kinase